jgi:hypothetical protein
VREGGRDRPPASSFSVDPTRGNPSYGSSFRLIIVLISCVSLCLTYKEIDDTGFHPRSVGCGDDFTAAGRHKAALWEAALAISSDPLMHEVGTVLQFLIVS